VSVMVGPSLSLLPSSFSFTFFSLLLTISLHPHFAFLVLVSDFSVFQVPLLVIFIPGPSQGRRIPAGSLEGRRLGDELRSSQITAYHYTYSLTGFSCPFPLVSLFSYFQ
jgi:hypothetical protein